MPPIQRKPTAASPNPGAASAKAAARNRSKGNQVTLREALPLLVLLVLLGLGGAAYAAHSQGWFATKPQPRSAATKPQPRYATAPTGSTGQAMEDSVRETLKEESVGLEQTQPKLMSDADVEKFKGVAVPLIYGFIFSRYDEFAASKLTFRDMKTFISKETGIPYEQLRTDELSAVIEDAVDAVTNTCEAGKTPRAECADKFRFGAKDA